LKVVFADEQKHHEPEAFFVNGSLAAHPESAERADHLLAAAIETGLTRESPHDYGLEFIAPLHTARYLHYLENIFTRWSRIEGASAEVIPGIHPDRRDCGYPASAAGQAGFHHADLSSPIGAATWRSALWSAHSAAHAARQVLAGDRACYALARPPGHHAARDYAAGFCYLANAGVAAEALRQRYARVAILDVDVHHGNGTQDIFYDRGDVLFVSLHGRPEDAYPYFLGYADETGKGKGEGCNINYPMAPGSPYRVWGKALESACRKIKAYGPDALVVSLGVDTYKEDPISFFKLESDDFLTYGARIAKLKLPTLIVMEGGYAIEAIGINTVNVLEGFVGG
jgi:acetoin utilization deacetylase AcuC-like enzyme